MKAILYQRGEYRIIEILDDDYDLEDLKGEVYDPNVNSDICSEVLKHEEKEFEKFVDDYGVFGYELQVWDGAVDKGWTHVDSCWGFVGHFDAKDERFNHYIVEEFEELITKKQKESLI